MKKYIILFLGLGICQMQGRAQSAPLPKCRHKIVIIAHRANHTRMPENSLAAIRDAIACGADYVEIDLRTSKDGYLVLSHDASLTRMTGAKGNVSDLSLAAIEQLSLRATVPDSNTYRVPQFREVLRLCKKKMNIYLDFKEADVAETWKQIREAGMEKQIVVYCNHPEQYTQWRSIAPRMPILASLPGEARTIAAADSFLQKMPVQVLDNVSDSALQAFVRSKGISIWLDVQNRDEGPASWQKALDKGVQGLQTDHPEALIPYIREKGL